jgi:NADP-reducing hydrogenase subunit HndB
MNAVKSPEELKSIKAGILKRMNEKETVRVKVHMGTSGLASGAREIYDFFRLELEKRNIQASVTSTGDMGYSFAEPTLEVKRPGEDRLYSAM